ncbi:MAG: c-type cytochrome biogenesis protein CcmI [Gammaproteobacteria bacterium]
MLTLWMGAMLMLIVALVLLLPTLFGLSVRNRDGHASAQALNVQIYRERQAALEAEQRAGSVTAEEFERARLELERELLADAQAEAGADGAVRLGPAGARRARAYMGLAVAVALPLGAVAMYWSFGPGEQLTAIASGATRAPAADAGAPTQAQIEGMVAGLAARLEQAPDDLEGWRMLARSYQVLERTDEALAAYERALDLAPDDVELLVNAAETQSVAAGNRLHGVPRARLERALELSPTHQKALWLGGIAALQAQEKALAKTRLERLAAMQPADSAQAEALRKLMVQAGLVADDGTAPATDAPALRVNVSIAPELAEKLDGSEAIYIFARDSEGPPMPIAAARRTVSELPLTLELGDADAMMPSRKLSDIDSVTVSARVSISGDARAAPGDFEATGVAVRRNEGKAPLAVDVLIDKVVQ